MNTQSNIDVVLSDADGYAISKLLESLAAINCEIDKKFRGGYFSTDYISEKLDKAARAIAEIKAAGTINNK